MTAKEKGGVCYYSFSQCPSKHCHKTLLRISALSSSCVLFLSCCTEITIVFILTGVSSSYSTVTCALPSGRILFISFPLRQSSSLFMILWWSTAGLPPVLSDRNVEKSYPSSNPYSHILGNQSL